MMLRFNMRIFKNVKDMLKIIRKTSKIRMARRRNCRKENETNRKNERSKRLTEKERGREVEAKVRKGEKLTTRKISVPPLEPCTGVGTDCVSFATYLEGRAPP